jgi:CubicO group peptidase (beta-lactamase class C family)
LCLTKVFVLAALLLRQLVEEGKLDVNAPASTYLNNLPATWLKVRVRQLASQNC